MPNNIHPLQGWIPYKLQFNNKQPQCHWLDTFNAPYLEPFFDETIGKLKGIPRRVTQFEPVSSVDMITAWDGFIDPVEPTSFIFHVSRCGSTLISQLLGTDDQNIVLPEVPVFDDILQLPYKTPDIDEAKAQKLLQATIRFYGQKRTGAEQHLFIKTDSWHMFFHRQLRKLYPNTPFILLYRTPGEVFNSHIKQRGIHTVPGLIEPRIFGFTAGEILGTNLNTYLARVLENYFSMYLEIAEHDKLTLLVNYNEGIMPIMDKIASFIKIPFSPGHYKKMIARAGFHSKHPGKVFSENRTDDCNPLLTKAFDLYRQTEEKRLAML